MTAAARFWADLGSRDFAAMQASGAAARCIAVLPVAAIEQHGPHLPLSVDTVLVNGLMAAAVPHLPPSLSVLFLPTQAVGLSPEHARFAGTLTLKTDTILRLWTDIAECVAAAGVKKLLIFNAHGGNVGVMDLVARDLRARLGLLVYSASWFNLPLTDALGQDVSALFDDTEHRFGIHAGDMPGWIWRRRKTLPRRRRRARRRSRFWATAKAPNWAGRCRTTTRPARSATPLRPLRPRDRRWWTRLAGRWRAC